MSLLLMLLGLTVTLLVLVAFLVVLEVTLAFLALVLVATQVTTVRNKPLEICCR